MWKRNNRHVKIYKPSRNRDNLNVLRPPPNWLSLWWPVRWPGYNGLKTQALFRHIYTKGRAAYSATLDHLTLSNLSIVSDNIVRRAHESVSHGLTQWIKSDLILRVWAVFEFYFFIKFYFYSIKIFSWGQFHRVIEFLFNRIFGTCLF